MLVLGILKASAAILAADLASGLVHWAEDTFGTEDTPIIGRWIVAPNVLHHHDATAFVHKGWLASSWDLALLGLSVMAVAWWLGLFGWPVVLLTCVGANANEIHKWNHLGRRAPAFVRVLWSSRLLQRPGHHAAHHRGQKNTHYCVVTPFLNPVLDGLGCWRGLERLLVPLFGAARRADLRGRRWR